MSRGLLITIALALGNTLWQVAGVIFLDWPMGNVFLLLWFENLLLVILAVVRMGSYRRNKEFSWGTFVMIAFQLLFFTLIHSVFSFTLATFAGFRMTMAELFLPAVLLVVRYSIEGWDQRERKPNNFKETYGFASARVVMLHIAILLCWFVFVWSFSQLHGGGAGLRIDPKLLVLLILLVAKATVEVYGQLKPVRAARTNGQTWALK